MAGNVESATRSRMQCRNSCGSELLSTHGMTSGLDPLQTFQACSVCGNVSGTQFMQKLVRWHIERVLPENSTDDDLRMCPHNIHHHGGTELCHIVCADRGHVVVRQEIVEPRLVFDDVVHPWKIQ